MGYELTYWFFNSKYPNKKKSITGKKRGYTLIQAIKDDRRAKIKGEIPHISHGRNYLETRGILNMHLEIGETIKKTWEVPGISSHQPT